KIKTALIIYSDENQGSFPSTLDELVGDGDYLTAVPVDPDTDEPYRYTPGADQRSFELCATLNEPVNSSTNYCVDWTTSGTMNQNTSTTNTTRNVNVRVVPSN
ncbi:MAG: hypothetical protein V1916_03385, partial [Patescibacteria group bacterium]